MAVLTVAEDELHNDFASQTILRHHIVTTVTVRRFGANEAEMSLKFVSLRGVYYRFPSFRLLWSTLSQLVVGDCKYNKTPCSQRIVWSNATTTMRMTMTMNRVLILTMMTMALQNVYTHKISYTKLGMTHIKKRLIQNTFDRNFLWNRLTKFLYTVVAMRWALSIAPFCLNHAKLFFMDFFQICIATVLTPQAHDGSPYNMSERTYNYWESIIMACG